MKLAIMQPYLFPYLGYFQMIHAVDVFIIYDDVNYIKGGWVNRNFILSQGKKQRMTLALHGASPNRLFNEVSVGDRPEKLLATIRQNYSKAPCFQKAYPFIEEILMQKERNLASFLDFSLRKTCAYLGISREWRLSSSLKKDTELRGQDKVIAICEELKATEYINLPGGKALYQKDLFLKKGIQLFFIDSHPITYPQMGNVFIPNLSIIDVVMFNDQAQCGALLKAYDLV